MPATRQRVVAGSGPAPAAPGPVAVPGGAATGDARALVGQEARALLSRLARVRPFVLHETMVPAACLSPDALVEIEHYLADGRRELRARVRAFLRWLESPGSLAATPAQIQQRFTFLRMRFNAVLSHFDIFADVMTQRSEHETGVWLAGLDVIALDALVLEGGWYEVPPVVCYLDRGHGAAIRRARTRLPGGGDNPAAVIRVPRERMVGSGIGSSLIHEVGHQGAELLDLVDSVRPVLKQLDAARPAERPAWALWDRWVSEVVADLWSVSRIGITSTVGLLGVVSLPRAFVFRVNEDEPHPPPWLRVLVSCAMGAALYPHAQWTRLAALWLSFYPLDDDDLDEPRRRLFTLLQATIPHFVRVLVTHRPAALHGHSVGDVLGGAERQPAALIARYRGWGGSFQRMRHDPPTLAMAAIGQARYEGLLSPEAEGRLLADLLTSWALHRVLRPRAAQSADGAQPAHAPPVTPGVHAVPVAPAPRAVRAPVST